MRELLYGLVISAVLTGAAHAQNCQRVGNQTYYNDGSSSRRVGNTTYFSDGRQCQQVGNQTYCN